MAMLKPPVNARPGAGSGWPTMWKLSVVAGAVERQIGDEGRRAHPGSARSRVSAASKNRARLSSGFKAGRRHPEVRGEQVRRIEAGRCRPHRHQRARQRRRRRPAARARARVPATTRPRRSCGARTGRRSSGVAKGIVQVGRCGQKRRHDAEGDAGRERHDRGEGEHPGVRAASRRVEAPARRCPQVDENTRPGSSAIINPTAPPDDRDHQAFDESCRARPAAAGAKRRPDSQFALAASRCVRAAGSPRWCTQPAAPRTTTANRIRQRQPAGTGQGLDQRNHVCPDALAATPRVDARHALRHGPEIRSRLRKRGAGVSSVRSREGNRGSDWDRSSSGA